MSLRILHGTLPSDPQHIGSFLFALRVSELCRLYVLCTSPGSAMTTLWKHEIQISNVLWLLYSKFRAFVSNASARGRLKRSWSSLFVSKQNVVKLLQFCGADKGLAEPYVMSGSFHWAPACVPASPFPVIGGKLIYSCSIGVCGYLSLNHGRIPTSSSRRR
jgi:hypothetical protein